MNQVGIDDHGKMYTIMYTLQSSVGGYQMKKLTKIITPKMFEH